MKKATQASALAVCAGTRAEVEHEHDGEFVIVDVEDGSYKVSASDVEASAETLAAEEAYRPAIRDQGFRRAVVTAYSHRCALCGIRVRTLDARTAVTAAHIVPWSETQDDRPANGMALCRMCHWTFDEGLLGVSQKYQVIASWQLTVSNNLPGYLTNLEGRGIVGPSRERFWPDTESLRWHCENVLRTQ